MDLILWRHAEAHPLPEDAGDAALDLQRRLTPKGERQAARMAQWLNQRLAQSTRIYVSPAVRTEATAAALGRPYKVHPGLSPGGSVEELLQIARWPDGSDPVLIVGHQPTLGLVAARLLTGQDLPWSIKKAAVWWLRYRDREGEGQVILQAVQSPDYL